MARQTSRHMPHRCGPVRTIHPDGTTTETPPKRLSKNGNPLRPQYQDTREWQMPTRPTDTWQQQRLEHTTARCDRCNRNVFKNGLRDGYCRPCTKTIRTWDA